jgi:hypothetical protein
MTAQVYADDGPARPVDRPGPVPGTWSPERSRPDASGDLPTVFEAAPMFRRALAGYDRFQVDTYVRWAEEELATADREREHLVARHLATLAALEETRQLLPHSAEGGEFLRLSRRIGSLLAAAADDASGMRAEAQADRAAAAAEAERTAAAAARLLADTRAEADRLRAEAATEVDAMVVAAGRIVEQAEETREQARAEAEARLGEVRAAEHRAVEHAALVRRRAAEEACAARLQVREEIVEMLTTGREERRRADAEAATVRERLDGEAVARRAALLAEVTALEHRRSALRAEIELLAGPAAGTTGGRLGARLRRRLQRLRWRSRSLPAS